MAKVQKLWHHSLRLSAVGAVLCATALTACSTDDEPRINLPQGHIAFGVEINNTAPSITRGQPQGGTRFGDLDKSIGAFGFAYDTWSASVQPSFMYNEELQIFENKFVTAVSYDAPTSGSKMRYYAYYPYSDKLDGSENGVKFSGLYDKVDGGEPKFQFTVAEKVENQIDLLVGESKFSDGAETPTYSIEKPVADWAKETPLTMRHMLTAIKFKTGGDNNTNGIPAGTLKTIKLKDVKYIGSFNFNSPNLWANIDNEHLRDFCDTLDITLDGTPGVELTDSGHYFMMLPQNLTTASVKPKIEIVYNDGSNDFTMEHELTGEWQRAKIVTYTLGVTAARRLRLIATRIVDWDDAGTWNGEVSDKSFLKLRSEIEDWNESGDTVRGDNYQKNYADYGYFKYAVADTTVVQGATFNGVELTNTRGYSTAYSSSNTSVATIDNMGNVDIVGVGTTVISATHAAEIEGGVTLYAAEEAKYTLTVTAP